MTDRDSVNFAILAIMILLMCAPGMYFSHKEYRIEAVIKKLDRD